MREEDVSVHMQTARQSVLYGAEPGSCVQPALLPLLLQPGLPSSSRLGHFESHLPEQGASGQSSHPEPQQTRNSTCVASGNAAVALGCHQHRVTRLRPPCQPRSTGEQAGPAAWSGPSPAPGDSHSLENTTCSLQTWGRSGFIHRNVSASCFKVGIYSSQKDPDPPHVPPGAARCCLSLTTHLYLKQRVSNKKIVCHPPALSVLGDKVSLYTPLRRSRSIP